MKKIEIYKNDELILSTIAEKYDITTYSDSFDIEIYIKELKITYSIPVNEGYRIIADI